MDDARRDAARAYRHGISPEDALRVPGYAALLDRLSRSDTAIDLLLSAPEEQRIAVLVLAILHLRAINGDPRLAPLYARLTRGAVTADDFADGVIGVVEADPDLVRTELHRKTQTNEVRRSAVLAAVLAQLRERGLKAVNLIDLGTSAGLNLYPDQYRPSTDASSDPLTLTCEMLGPVTTFGVLPEINTRVGIDLNPLDLTNQDDAAWLRACLWPEEPERLRRLERIEELLPTWPPRTLLRGGVLERLDDALALCDSSATTVVMDTWSVAYFSEADQRTLRERLTALASSGAVAWIACEWPRGVPGLDLPEPRTPEPRPGACQVVVAEPFGAVAPWGWCHPHGRWLSLDPPGPKG